MNGVLHEEPERSIFEGKVLRIEHDWGEDFDVQAGGGAGEPPDTWLTEHVLGRFEGRRVRITIEAIENA